MSTEKRCEECGSWDRECSADGPVPGCCCVRCGTAALAAERTAHRVYVQRGLVLEAEVVDQMDTIAKQLAISGTLTRERDEARAALAQRDRDYSGSATVAAMDALKAERDAAVAHEKACDAEFDRIQTLLNAAQAECDAACSLNEADDRLKRAQRTVIAEVEAELDAEVNARRRERAAAETTVSELMKERDAARIHVADHEMIVHELARERDQFHADRDAARSLVAKLELDIAGLKGTIRENYDAYVGAMRDARAELAEAQRTIECGVGEGNPRCGGTPDQRGDESRWCHACLLAVFRSTRADVAWLRETLTELVTTYDAGPTRHDGLYGFDWDSAPDTNAAGRAWSTADAALAATSPASSEPSARDMAVAEAVREALVEKFTPHRESCPVENLCERCRALALVEDVAKRLDLAAVVRGAGR